MVWKVDRICTGRDVEGNDIKVSAEPHVGEVRQMHLKNISTSNMRCTGETLVEAKVVRPPVHMLTTTCTSSRCSSTQMVATLA